MALSMISPNSLAAFVIAVCFAVGLNAYATIFALGLMSRLNWVSLPPGLELIANHYVMWASGLLFACEFFADKIPGFDLFWNVLHTFVRIPVAALLAYSASSHLPPGAQLFVVLLGAAFATVAHGSKTAARVVATASPEPFSNIGLSAGEDGIAVGLAWLATHYPYAAEIATGIAVVICGILGWMSYRILHGAALRFGRRWKRLDSKMG